MYTFAVLECGDPLDDNGDARNTRGRVTSRSAEETSAEVTRRRYRRALTRSCVNLSGKLSNFPENEATAGRRLAAQTAAQPPNSYTQARPVLWREPD